MSIMACRHDSKDVNRHHARSWLPKPRIHAIAGKVVMPQMNVVMSTRHLLVSLHACIRRCSKPATMGLFAALLTLQGCVGSPAGIESKPDFVLQTPYGPVGVSMRQPLPGMTATESTVLVRSGMQQALPAMHFIAPTAGRDPPLRLVWHVNLQPPNSSMATMVLNVFDGLQPVWYEAAPIAGDCTPIGLTSTVAAMTRRAAAVAVSMALGFAPAAGAGLVPPGGDLPG